MRVRVTELCDQIIGGLETSSAWRTASIGAVREIDEDAQPIAFLHDLLAELGEPVVLRRLGLEVTERVLDVVHQLDVRTPSS